MTTGMITQNIWVTFQKEGIHCYPEAGVNEALKNVSFLANPHRHMFHFRVELQVKHDNRDVEFILFKRELEQLYQGTLELNNKSCEMIAKDLLQYITAKYQDRNCKIEVSEDKENGCVLEYRVGN